MVIPHASTLYGCCSHEKPQERRFEFRNMLFFFATRNFSNCDFLRIHHICTTRYGMTSYSTLSRHHQGWPNASPNRWQWRRKNRGCPSFSLFPTRGCFFCQCRHPRKGRDDDTVCKRLDSDPYRKNAQGYHIRGEKLQRTSMAGTNWPAT